MKRKALIVFQSILGYMALVYCGPRVIEGEYIWLDNFTEAFKGYGINGILIPVLLMFFYNYVDRVKQKYKNDTNYIITLSVIFAIIMAIGRYFQYKVVSTETSWILYFQIFLIYLIFRVLLPI